MSTDGIKLEGLEEVQKIMKRLPEEFNNRVLVSVARKAAQPLVAEARRLAPVSTISRTDWWGKRVSQEPGALRKSIVARKQRNNRGISVGPSAKKGWWAHFVEFGTAGYTVKKGKRNNPNPKNIGRFIPGQKPQPFMGPAFRNTTDQIVSEYAGNFKDILEKFQNKYGKK